MTYVPAATPAGVNYCLNPVAGSSFGLGGTSNAGGGASNSRGVYTGFGRAANTCFQVIWDAAANGGWTYINWGETAATNPVVTPGDQLTYTAWAFATHADIGCFISIQWSDASYNGMGDVVSGTVYGLNDGQWHQLRLDVTVPAGVKYARLHVEFPTRSSGPAGHMAAITDLMLAPTAQGDGFIWGGAPNCAWVGTPNQSASTRLAVATQGPAGTGGQLAYGVTYTASDLTNGVGADITPSITGGTITDDIDRAIIGTCTITGTDATTLTTGRWVAIAVTTATEDGRTVTTQQRGLFRLGQPRNTGTEGGSTVEVTGVDVTTLLTAYRFTDTYNIPVGTNVQTALVNLIGLCGLTRHAIPPTTRTTGIVRSYKPGDPLTDATSSLTTAMGWYDLYATYDGQITTRVYRALDTTAPTRTYVLGQDSQLVGDIVTERSQSSFANVIIAVRDNPTLGLMKSVARNDDPRLPGSTTYPGGLGTVADTLIVNTDVDQAALDRLAQQELAKRGTQAACTIQTLPDLALDTHDVVQVVVDPVLYPHLQQASGKWYVQHIDLPLAASKALMTVKLRRQEGL